MDMTFGFTLSSSFFENRPESPDIAALCGGFGSKEALWDYLAGNVDSIEIGGIRTGETDGTFLEKAVEKCVNSGLCATFHGALGIGPDAGKTFFEPYLPLFASGLLPLYNITVHPKRTVAETVPLLRSGCCIADEKDYPVRITLENQRYKDEENREMLCMGVKSEVRTIASERLKLCFDFGHRLSGVRKFGQALDPVDEEFFSLVRHTHIHSLYRGVTHFPLTHGENELNENLSALARHGYSGVLNLELYLSRFKEPVNVKEAVEGSVNILKKAAGEAQRS